jgi:hypothetical protein
VTPGAAPPSAEPARERRLRSPLLVSLWVLLGFEGAGGLVIFVMRLVSGETPGETLHVGAGALLAPVYVLYQWRHWKRVRPWRNRLDHALGLISAASMAGALGTGLALALPWWELRVVERSEATVPYPPLLSAAHNIMSLLVLTFAAAHVAAVLLRDVGGRRKP